ncbi:protein kinase family protein [Bacillus atrophaeus]|uniref:protein kinase family protein n=1 Tax=Bacillus atrophaeus TaxID=1452 RepID=UPI0022809826|nr:protein kinase family protein [Bacillus atrophaeus]MCY8908756.1 protein kinase family protein [Bacillus atrophaeus]MEC0836596.1 protein kinase family protein [Bacillus atrophaeus]MEC0844769.1 protein kinase family protein [Bacillus atrophaeus]MEC0848889.1 protein kinase family protein [Bacillus atrophaeus]MEC0863715.1 protein kinase family protein [Bacillus atrophaeus]
MSVEVDNLIITVLDEIDYLEVHPKYSDIYNNIEHEELRELLTKLHSNISESFKTMNTRLPTTNGTAHFWADPSRTLLKCIEISERLYYKLKETKIPIQINDYYRNLFQQCGEFLSSSGGSTIPSNMEKIDIYYKIPIYSLAHNIQIKSPTINSQIVMKSFDEGSYANIFKYKDPFYNKHFIVKKAKKDLNSKEIERFKLEYETLKSLSSPYIAEVFTYDDDKNQYVMEYMNWNLHKFILTKNTILSAGVRKKIVYQIFKAFEYIHSKSLLHRDISPNNILLNEYEDALVVKVSDFGLVKLEDSQLTALDTDFKGRFNDPALKHVGFKNYAIHHEIYALTYVVYFVMTGKTTIKRTSNESLNQFIDAGLNHDFALRPKTVNELKNLFIEII